MLKLLRPIFLCAALLAFTCPPLLAAFAIFQIAGSPTGWHVLHIGGGGFLTGGNQSADGQTTVVRGDVFNGFVSYQGSAFSNVVTSAAIPSSIYNAAGFNTLSAGTGRGGPYELVVAPNADNTLYMMWMGELLVSTTSPPTSPSFSICGGWSQLALSINIDGNNGNFRFNGPHFAVDPANSGVAYFGTPENGVFTTANGCSSSSAISTATIAAAGTASGSACGSGTCHPGYVIRFDSSGGTTTGKTKNIYVAGWGNHIYQSLDAGGTWTAFGTGPTSALGMSVCPSGVVWVTSSIADDTGGNYNLWKYSGGSGGTWTQMTLAGVGGGNASADVACDPNNSSHVVSSDSEGNIRWTSNGGTTWNGPYTTSANVSISATDVPWIQWLFANNAAQTQPNIGQIFFDGATANKLWMTSGFEVMFANNISTGMAAPGSGCCAVAWNSFTAGTEMENAIGVTSPPNGNGSVILNTEQFNWYIPNTNTSFNPYPSNGTPSVANTFSASWSTLLPGWSSDYVGGTPTTVVGMANGLTNLSPDDYSWKSTNSGASTSVFASQTGGTFGGSIAAASASVILSLSASSGPFITTNGGTSWGAITIAGANSSGWGVGGGFSLSKQSCADKVTNGSLYLMNTVNGLYVSTDGAGATWNLATGTGLTPAAGFLNKLICVPKLGSVNTAGHLIWNPGNYQSQTNPVYFSNNQGASWSQIPNISTANSVGIGAPKPGGNGYPVIWVVGIVNSVYGVYHCDNYNSSNNTGCAISDWINIGTFPNNSLDIPFGIDGDQNTYGRAYIAMQGSGFVQWN